MSETTPGHAAILLGLSVYGVWKAIERGVLQATRHPETGRYSVAFDEIERYRRDHLGRQGQRKETS